MIRNCWYVAGFTEEFAAGEIHGLTLAGRLRTLVAFHGLVPAGAAGESRCPACGAAPSLLERMQHGHPTIEFVLSLPPGAEFPMEP